MCNNYASPTKVDLERGWNVQAPIDASWKPDVFPGFDAPIIRRTADGGRECVLARFGLVPWWSKTEKVGWATTNSRSESAAVKTAFKAPYARRQWCIVPAWTIFEPFYPPGAKRSERWGIERADGTALGIAGMWERWRSPVNGANVTSFTMLTVNCDEHPLLKRFHKHLDESGTPNERRTPVLLREDDYDRWLDVPNEDAPAFFTTFGSDDLQADARPLVRPGSPAPKVAPLQFDLLSFR